MNIKELSAKIDTKLREIDVQISTAEKKLTLSPELANDIKTEVAQLQQLKAKLSQSKDIAQRAHDLQTGNDLKRIRKLNYLGIFLIAFSLLGLAAIAFLLIFH